MNEIIKSLLDRYANATRKITDKYIYDNVQILIKPLVYLLDSGITDITTGNNLEYDFYNFTDDDGYVSRLSKTLIPNYTFYKGYIEDSNTKRIIFKGEVDQSIGNPGEYLCGMYSESSDKISCAFSWFDIYEYNTIKPKSLFCIQDSKCYAIIDHGTCYNIIFDNKECYVDIEELLSNEREEIEKLLYANYQEINSQTDVQSIRPLSLSIDSDSQKTPYNVKFDCSFVEKTIWQHNVDPQVSDVEE